LELAFCAKPDCNCLISKRYFSYQKVEHTAFSDELQTLLGIVPTQWKDRRLQYWWLTDTSRLILINSRRSRPCWIRMQRFCRWNHGRRFVRVISCNYDVLNSAQQQLNGSAVKQNKSVFHLIVACTATTVPSLQF